MKVLFVIHYPVFGGPHNQAAILAPALEGHGASITVLLPDEPGTAVGRLRGAGVDVTTIALHRVRAKTAPGAHAGLFAALPREVAAIRKVIRETDADIVQIGGLVNPHGAFAGHLEGAAVVWQLVDTRAPMPLRRLMMPLVTGLTDVLMTTGAAVAHVHPGAEALGDRLRVFYPPVDSDFFTISNSLRDSARDHFGLAADDVVLGTVGNLNPQKGHEFLLEAVALVCAVRNDVKLLVVGESHSTHRAYERRLRTLARRLNSRVGLDVSFVGGMQDVRPAFAAMDLFALPSVPRSEGAPTVVGEAMMMSLPVIASNVGAVGELVDDGVTGVLVPPQSPEAIARAIIRVLGDAEARHLMGSRGRERAVARFSIEECTRVHLDAYERALHVRRSRRRRRALRS